ncbi:MAG: transporter substrate-binding domain-containing protein [Desulfobacteraceae bacterium]
MKYRAILLLIVFSSLFAGTCPAQETVRIATGEWPPYISKKLKHQGVVTHIIREAFKLENIKAEFSFFPWKRSKLLVKNGKFDACSVWAKFAVMEKEFYYSDTVAKGEFVFFHPKSIDFAWSSIDDLKHYKIGGVLGNVYSEKIKQAEKNGYMKIYYKPAELDVMKLLIHGKVEVFPVNRQVGYFLLNKHFSEEEAGRITHHGKPLRISRYSLIFSRAVEKNRERVKQFNRGLAKLKKSGRYDRFLMDSRLGNYILLE